MGGTAVRKLKLMIILGTRPEIIRLSEVIKKCDRYFEHILVHTGQNWDYTLNQIFFEDLGLRRPDYYLDAVGADLGETIATAQLGKACLESAVSEGLKCIKAYYEFDKINE